jgi:hypothetical protein
MSTASCVVPLRDDLAILAKRRETRRTAFRYWEGNRLEGNLFTQPGHPGRATLLEPSPNRTRNGRRMGVERASNGRSMGVQWAFPAFVESGFSYFSTCLPP